jgi:hypothetical protein
VLCKSTATSNWEKSRNNIGVEKQWSDSGHGWNNRLPCNALLTWTNAHFIYPLSASSAMSLRNADALLATGSLLEWETFLAITHQRRKGENDRSKRKGCLEE